MLFVSSFCFGNLPMSIMFWTKFTGRRYRYRISVTDKGSWFLFFLRTVWSRKYFFLKLQQRVEQVHTKLRIRWSTLVLWCAVKNFKKWWFDLNPDQKSGADWKMISSPPSYSPDPYTLWCSSSKQKKFAYILWSVSLSFLFSFT